MAQYPQQPRCGAEKIKCHLEVFLNRKCRKTGGKEVPVFLADTQDGWMEKGDRQSRAREGNWERKKSPSPQNSEGNVSYLTH